MPELHPGEGRETGPACGRASSPARGRPKGPACGRGTSDHDIYLDKGALFRCADGSLLAVFQDRDAPSPRAGQGNLSAMYAWAPGRRSPDECPYASPRDFLAQVLRDAYPEPAGLVEQAVSFPGAPFRLVLDEEGGGVGFETLGVARIKDGPFWSAEAAWDAPAAGEPLASRADARVYGIVAAWPDAPLLVQGRCALMPLMFDPSSATYSTFDYQAHGDSDQVGYVYVSPQRLREACGGPGVPLGDAIAAAKAACADEVARFDGWQKRECYRYCLLDSEGRELKSRRGGFIDRGGGERGLLDEMCASAGVAIAEDLGACLLSRMPGPPSV